MKITMLGTGNALVTDCYNTCFVMENEKNYLLVDGGGGNTLLSRLKSINLQCKDIRNVFVTHKHTDHIMGIIWFVRIICQGFSGGKLAGTYYIYGHDEVLNIIKNLSGILLREKETKYIGENLKLVEVKNGETVDIIGHEFQFFDIHSNKAKQFGFTTNINGQKFSCCGDEPYNETIKDYIINSDWLMHEAFCLERDAELFNPYEKQHSTVKDACLKASELGIKNLILYHTEDKNLKSRKELYINEGKKYFSGNIFVPDDLESIYV